MKGFMENFAEKHPKAAQWIREGGLFILFSYVVTFIKYLLLTFLPGFYQGLVGDVEWVWPGIRTQVLGVPFTLALIGNSLADGGLAFTLANYTSIILGECIRVHQLPAAEERNLPQQGPGRTADLFPRTGNDRRHAGHEPVHLHLEPCYGSIRNSGRGTQHRDNDRDGRRRNGHYLCH